MTHDKRIAPGNVAGTLSNMPGTLSPPHFRRLVLVIGALFVLTFALLAANLRDAPIASASHTPEQYNLCARTPAVRDHIIRALRAWGDANTDFRYHAPQRFGCGSIDHDLDRSTPPVQYSAIIPADDLFAHTDWTTYNGRLVIGRNGLNADTLTTGDFAGLNATIFDINRSYLETLPARLFEGLTIQQLTIWDNRQLESLHEDVFEGIAGTGSTGQGMGFTFEKNPLITAESLPPTVFDPLGNSAEAPSNNQRDKGGIQGFTFRRNGVTQLNTRWFAHFRHLGATYDWGGINLADASATEKTEYWDTYYYDDGDGRYTDSSKTTPGVNSITNTTTKANIAAAIEDAIDSVGDASDTKADYTTGNTLSVTTANFGSVDLCDRTPAVRDVIFAELRTQQSAIYGTRTVDPQTGVVSYTNGSYDFDGDGTGDAFGCRSGARAVVTKGNLNNHTMASWATDAAGLNLNGKGLTSIKFHDFRYLDVDFITFGSNSITELPDDVFSGLPLQILRLNRIGLTKLQSRLFTGIDATNLKILGLADNHELSDVNIDPDVFDPLIDLRYLDLNDGAIGRVNTRWFKELTKLGDGEGWYHLNLSEQPVVSYFYNDGGGYHDGGATGKTAFDPTSTTDQAAMRTAILAAIDTPRTVNIAGTKFKAPDEFGIDPCGRTEVVWKELMRQFGLLPEHDISLQGYTDAIPTPIDYQIADIRFERYDNITVSDCPVFRAHWVNKNTGDAIADQAAPNAVTDVLSIKFPPQHIFWRGLNEAERAFNLSGADLSRITAADLADLHSVEVLHIQDTNLENPPSRLFAHMPKLTEINLAGNKLTTSDFTANPNFLSPLVNLEELNLNDNLFTSFDADWIPAAARTTLDRLYLEGNPMTTTDLAGLNVRILSIARSSVTRLDTAIQGMTNLRRFDWSDLRALPLDGINEYVEALPTTLVLSYSGDRLGNPGDLEGTDLNTALINLQQTQLERLAEIRSAEVRFSDACRPPISSVAISLANTRQEAWEQNFGNLCVTNTQREALLDALSEFDNAISFNLVNLDMSDAQVARLLTFAHEQPYGGERRITTLRLVGNPDAFGDGFNEAALEGFDHQVYLQSLTLSHSDLNFAQANTILRNLETAYTPQRWGDTRGFGLGTLDFSFNTSLFTDVDAASMKMFLRGVMNFRPNSFSRVFKPVEINLRATDLNFDQLKAMLDSMDGGYFDNYAGESSNVGDLRRVRALNVSDNANVWKRKNQSDEWVDVPTDEVYELITRLPGLTSLSFSTTSSRSSIGGPDALTQDRLEAIFNALDHAPSTNRYADPRDTSTLERMSELNLSHTNLSVLTAAELKAEFAKMGSSNALQNPTLRTLGLADTLLLFEQFKGIVDGLDAAGQLDGIYSLDLAGNINVLHAGCSTGGVSDELSALLARFTNLRHLDISRTAPDFEILQCVVNGLNAGDGSAQDGVASNLISLNLRDNPGIFELPDSVQKADKDDVAAAFGPLRNARVNLAKTEISPAQAYAILQSRLAGQNEEQQREIRRSFTGQNPAFSFQTPLPSNTRVLSGRGSLRVSFTHNPVVDGESFEVIRYEYRYREDPEDDSTAWGNTGGEAWADANLDLTNTGDKSFDIYGLKVQTLYQLQLRAISLAQPNVLTLTGGTSVNLPRINAIKPAITEINLRAGDQVRLEVDVYGLTNKLDNTIPDKDGVNLIFAWSDDSGGSFANPNDGRRVVYTAPSLPGTYQVTAEAGPDGICRKHHDSPFGISDAARSDCIATFTVRVSRAQTPVEPPADPVNPAGIIPTSLTDSEGIAYSVFTPVDGGTFSGDGITVAAASGAVPDRQLLGVSASVSVHRAPEPVPGARMTVDGSLYDVSGVQASGQRVAGFNLDEPLSVCLPLPTAFRANLTNIVLVERKSDTNYGILSSRLRQTAGELNVCGQVSTLPATVGVAKLGIVPVPPPTPMPDEIATPDTGATSTSPVAAMLALILGALLLFTGIRRIGRIRRGQRPATP